MNVRVTHTQDFVIFSVELPTKEFFQSDTFEGLVDKVCEFYTFKNPYSNSLGYFRKYVNSGCGQICCQKIKYSLPINKKKAIFNRLTKGSK